MPLRLLMQNYFQNIIIIIIITITIIAIVVILSDDVIVLLNTAVSLLAFDSVSFHVRKLPGLI